MEGLRLFLPMSNFLKGFLLCLYHVGYIVESRVFPVGGAVISEQPVSVSIRKTSWSWLSLPTPGRAPPSGWTHRDTFKQNCRRLVSDCGTQSGFTSSWSQ